MKEIKLKGGSITYVDDEDYEYLNQFHWLESYGYAKRNIMINGKLKSLLMHRVIMKPPVNLVVDHIDHNKLNNQKYNLRNCTSSENVMNGYALGETKLRNKPIYDFNKIIDNWNTKNPDAKLSKSSFARELVDNGFSISQTSALVFMAHSQDGLIKQIKFKLLSYLMERFNLTASQILLK